MPLVYRLTKGSALTHAEGDGNLSFLDNKIDGVIGGLTPISYTPPSGTATTIPSVLNKIIDVTTRGADPTGVADSTTAIQNTITYVAGLGGGTIYFPRGDYKVTATIFVEYQNIFLKGDGASWTRQGTQLHRDDATTRIFWDTNGTPTAGQALVHFRTPSAFQGKLGGGMKDIMLDGNAEMPVGLKVESWRSGRFDDLFLYACTDDQLLLACSSYAPPSGPNDCIGNTFTNVMVSTFGGAGWYLTNEARGLRLTGGQGTANGATGNSCFNNFINCRAYMSKGNALVHENGDNNAWFGWTGGAAYGSTSGYHIIIGSGDQDSTGNGSPARAARFYRTEGLMYIHSDQNGGNSPWGIGVDLMRTNGVTEPVVQTPGGGALWGTYYLLSTGTSTEVPKISAGQLQALTHTDSTAMDMGLLLSKKSSVGSAGQNLMKIQWAGTNDAGTSGVHAGRIEAAWIGVTPGSETARIGLRTQVSGNDGAQTCMDWQNGVRVPTDTPDETLNYQGFGTLNVGEGIYVENEPVAIKLTSGQLGGGDVIGQRRTTLTTNTTLDAVNSIIFVNAAGGNVTVTLPLANLWGTNRTGQLFIRRIDASGNTVTIQRQSADTLNGGTSETLAAGVGKHYVSDASTAWYSN